MSPEMLVRISGRNDTRPAFGQVVADAKAASKAVVTSGAAATAALEAETAASVALGEAAALNTGQQMALMHSVRSVSEQLALGVGPGQALAGQMSHLSYVFSGPGGLMGGLRAIGGTVAGLVTKFWPVVAVVGAISLAVAGLTQKINENQKQQVSWGNVVVATWQVASEALTDLFGPAIAQVQGWFSDFVDWITPAFKGAINGIVGFFAQGFQHAVVSWQLLPAAISDLTVQAMNGVLSAIEDMLNSSRAQIVKFMADTGAMLGPFGSGLVSGAAGLAGAGKISLGQIANPNAGTASFIAGNTDYAGQAFDAIKSRATLLAIADAAEKAKTKVGSVSTEMGKLADHADAFGDAAKSAFSNLGTGIIDAFTKGGNVAGNVLDMLLGKLGSFGEQLANSGFNQLLNLGLGALSSALTGSGAGFSYGGGFMDPWAGMRFANGGSFTVGGAGGTDSQRVSFMATPGEKVKVTKPGQGDGSAQVNFNFYGKVEPSTVQLMDQWAKTKLPGYLGSYRLNPHRVG
jgi:hypothetical protein